MDSLLFVFRFVYRIRWWLIIVPVVAALIAIYMTRNLPLTFHVSSTVHTGVVSGYNINANDEIRPDMHAQNSMIDNLINIIKAQSTLKNVSLRLYAQDMMNGDPKHDNNYIMASNFRSLQNITPADVKKLIHPDSVEVTMANLRKYEKPDPKNFVYGLFYWFHRHYSYNNALSNIDVKRLGNSDIIQIDYEADDPGIAYNTLMLLNDEFIKQYNDMRFGETNNVIAYFERELRRVGRLLREAEDSLTQFNVDNKVINYDEQTTQLAVINTQYELQNQQLRLDYSGSEALIKQMEKQIDENVLAIQSNAVFLGKLQEISDLTTRIAQLETFDGTTPSDELTSLKKRLAQVEKEFEEFSTTYTTKQYTKEGVSSHAVIPQWLDQLVKREKAIAELKVMNLRKGEIDDQYLFFSPIGSQLKRQEREINFLEQTYLNILHNLNAARVREKSLEMSTATLKILTPPTFPLASTAAKRKLIVLIAFFGALAFVLGYFFIIELLDRTLRDKTRTERLTGGKVLSAFPGMSKLRYRGYAKESYKIAANTLSNALFTYFDNEKKPNVINAISIDQGEGKSFITSHLASYWEEMGLNVKVISWNSDFDPNSKKYILAERISDLYTPQNEDVIIVEHPPMDKFPLSQKLLQDTTMNLLIAKATHTWQDSDKTMYRNIEQSSGTTPIMFCLNNAERIAVEQFTGQLPPYTKLRKIIYRFYQLGLTSKDK